MATTFLTPICGILPAVDPLDALTDTGRKDYAADTAPAVAAWLHNPAATAKPKTYAQILEEDEPWTGPDHGTEENPAE